MGSAPSDFGIAEPPARRAADSQSTPLVTDSPRARSASKLVRERQLSPVVGEAQRIGGVPVAGASQLRECRAVGLAERREQRLEHASGGPRRREERAQPSGARGVGAGGGASLVLPALEREKAVTDPAGAGQLDVGRRAGQQPQLTLRLDFRDAWGGELLEIRGLERAQRFTPGRWGGGP